MKSPAKFPPNDTGYPQHILRFPRLFFYNPPTSKSIPFKSTEKKKICDFNSVEVNSTV